MVLVWLSSLEAVREIVEETVPAENVPVEEYTLEDDDTEDRKTEGMSEIEDFESNEDSIEMEETK